MTDWRHAARCRDEDPELFFPISETADNTQEQIAEAKAVCAGCTVREQCGDWADEHDKNDGIWGGRTTHERQVRRRRRAREAERRRARQEATR